MLEESCLPPIVREEERLQCGQGGGEHRGAEQHARDDFPHHARLAEPLSDAAEGTRGPEQDGELQEEEEERAVREPVHGTRRACEWTSRS